MKHAASKIEAVAAVALAGLETTADDLADAIYGDEVVSAELLLRDIHEFCDAIRAGNTCKEDVQAFLDSMRESFLTHWKSRDVSPEALIGLEKSYDVELAAWMGNFRDIEAALKPRKARDPDGAGH